MVLAAPHARTSGCCAALRVRLRAHALHTRHPKALQPPVATRVGGRYHRHGVVESSFRHHQHTLIGTCRSGLRQTRRHLWHQTSRHGGPRAKTQRLSTTSRGRGVSLCLSGVKNQVTARLDPPRLALIERVGIYVFGFDVVNDSPHPHEASAFGL